MKYINDEMNPVPISKIGLGTGRFGTRISEEDAFRLLDIFFTRGGTVLDTARNYYEWEENGRGRSEETIGKWLESRKIRDKVCVATKCGVKNEGTKWMIDLSREKLLEEQKESLDALRTDRIDIYLLHRDEPSRPVEEIVDTMQALRERGRVSRIGVCNWKAERILKAHSYAVRNHLEPFSVVQTWWSLAEYTNEMWNDPNLTNMDEETYEYLYKNHFIGMAYTSQCKGFFQKAALLGLEGVDDFLKERIATEGNKRKLEALKEICREEGITPTAVVNGYITDNKVEGIALVSCGKMEQLTDILDHCDVKISGEIIDKLDAVV